MKQLLAEIAREEGYEGFNYKDTLGYPTIGFGTKLPLSEAEAMLILRFRIEQKIDQLNKEKPITSTLSKKRQNVLYNMTYQLGVNGVLKFKKMWAAIEQGNFETASEEMLNSRWHIQTPKRAERLALVMRSDA